MVAKLSYQNWSDLWEESIQRGEIACQSDSFDALEQGSVGQLCKIYDRRVELRAGLTLYIYDYEPLEDIIISEQGSAKSYFASSFFVLGNVRTTLHGITGNVNESAGKNYLSHYSSVLETEEWKSNQRILRVKILVHPSYFFTSFGANEIESLPQPLKKFAENAELQPFYQLGETTPDMQVALHQILHCPYQGLIKRIYLESKVLELMTLQFSQLTETDRPFHSKPSLRSDDVARIYQARDILIGCIDDPPSLLELAHRVGINDHKLKLGFRQVFKTTVFGYLHQYRLEQARQLIETSDIAVVKVAQQVGFADRSYFAAAFRKKYGVNPGVYRQQCRRKISVETPLSHQKNSV